MSDTDDTQPQEWPPMYRALLEKREIDGHYVHDGTVTDLRQPHGHRGVIRPYVFDGERCVPAPEMFAVPTSFYEQEPQKAPTREALANAWDEGARAATTDYGIGKAHNPYRDGEKSIVTPGLAPA